VISEKAPYKTSNEGPQTKLQWEVYSWLEKMRSSIRFIYRNSRFFSGRYTIEDVRYAITLSGTIIENTMSFNLIYGKFIPTEYAKALLRCPIDFSWSY